MSVKRLINVLCFCENGCEIIIPTRFSAQELMKMITIGLDRIGGGPSTDSNNNSAINQYVESYRFQPVWWPGNVSMFYCNIHSQPHRVLGVHYLLLILVVVVLIYLLYLLLSHAEADITYGKPPMSIFRHKGVSFLSVDETIASTAVMSSHKAGIGRTVAVT